jgi:uncharacterized protein (UPF0276 family)
VIGSLGVGVICIPKLEPLIEAAADLIDVIEVEPQTLWRRAEGAVEQYRVDANRLVRIKGLPGRKILHGVGFPIGSVRPPSAAQLPPLREMIDALAPPWMSEHLAFNRAAYEGRLVETGFLLPPRQTPAGVDAAVASIRSIASALAIPFAIENGPSYLAPRSDEMTEGACVAEIVERADCGLVLDLHNAWASHRNGRQPIDAFLAQIPLDRVWEIHLAGGMDYRGYWIDAHCGDIADEVIEVAKDVIPDLANLKALIFELTSSFVDRVDPMTVRRALEQLRALWERRRPTPMAPIPRDRPGEGRRDDTGPTPQEWEDTLGALVIGRAAEGELARTITADPGLDIYRYLVGEFRASTMIGVLPFSGRLLLITLGAERLEALLADFWRQSPPEAFGSREARRFAEYLTKLDLGVPLLAELLAYDMALVAAFTEGTSQSVRFRHDPRPILSALAAHRAPQPGVEADHAAEVTPDGIAFYALETRTVEVV